MSGQLEQTGQALLAAALKAGAEAADAITIRAAANSIEVRGGKLEQATRAETTDAGLRVFIGKRQAVVSASDTGADTIAAMAERAVAMAREAPEDPTVGLAEPGALATDRSGEGLELADPAPEPDADALERDARAAEAAALAVSGVAQVQSAGAGYSTQEVHFAATNGFSGGYTRTTRSIVCMAVAGSGTGMEQSHDADARSFQADLRPAADIGRIAGERAVESLGARKPKTGTFPVVYDERISSSLIGHLLSACNGQAIARGASWLKDALGEQVLPAHLSLIEDPHRPRAARSRPFDGEGLPTNRRAIIENGVLTGWTLDLSNARKLGMASTGNAVRGPSSPPSPGNWNLELTAGDMDREALLREMGTGLLVTSLIGSTINPNTGDYSRGASGFWVENGELKYPVNECTIAGNLSDMLRWIVPANDARPWLSQVVPSLLIEGMTLAGN